MNSQKTKGIKIIHKETEKIRQYLVKKNLIRFDLKIIKDQKFSFIPIIKMIDEIKDFEIVEKKFEKQKQKYNSYKDYLSIEENIKKNIGDVPSDEEAGGLGAYGGGGLGLTGGAY